MWNKLLHRGDSGNKLKPTESAPEVTDVKTDDGSHVAGVKDKLLVENASVKESFGVVSEVQKYPEFLTLYQRVDILSEETDPVTGDNIRVAKYVIKIPTLLHAFIRDLSYTLKLTTRVTDTQSEMLWDQIDGPSFVKVNQGHWRATQMGENTELQLEMALGYSFYLPQNLKNYIQTSILHDSLNSIKKRCQEMQVKQSTA